MSSLAGLDPRPLRILMFSEATYPRHPGGAGKHAHLLAAGLVKRGHVVRILCRSTSEHLIETVDGVEVHRLPEPLPVSADPAIHRAQVVSSIVDYVERVVGIDGFDIIHDHGGFLSYFWTVAYQIRREWRKPMLLQIVYLNAAHELAEDPERTLFPFSSRHIRVRQHQSKIQCYAVRLANLVACVSQSDMELVRRLYMPRRCVVLPPPLDPQCAFPSPDPEWRTRLSPNGEKIVLFAGRIDSSLKGPGVVLRACRTLFSSRQDIRLVLVGNTRPDDFKTLGDRVMRLGWISDAATIGRIMSAADAVVVPSLVEPFGMVCAEAMANGVPVIASPVGGLKHMIRHGETGYLLSTSDARIWPAEMAALLDHVLSHPDEQRRVGDNARAWAFRSLDRESLISRLEGHYREILADNNEARPPLFGPEVPHQAQAAYLDLIRRITSPEFVPVAQQVLTRIQTDPDRRCSSCTGRHLDREVAALLAAGTPAALRRAVLSACPLGLLQKQTLAAVVRSERRVPAWKICVVRVSSRQLRKAYLRAAAAVKRKLGQLRGRLGR